MLTAGYAGPASDANFNSRQGVNPYETVLGPGNPPGSTTATHFLQVDTNDLPSGAVSNPIMAQPLYVAGITGSSPAQGTCSPCNMVIGVTLNSTVFAWNADGTGAGNLLWSRQGASGNSPGGNALWSDDCGSLGGPKYQGDTLKFEGILSTPVIDASGSVPVIFLTSGCVDSSANGQWWLHEIDLTTGHDVVVSGVTQHREIAGPSSDFSGITAGFQQQRPALLQVKNSLNSSKPNLIYILFGTNIQENLYAEDYTGWVVAYTNGSSGLQPVFAYSNEQTSCGTGGGFLGGSNNGQCSGNSGAPSCDCYVGTGATSAPNWGGHGGGCWMSGNGPAASTNSTVKTSGGSADNSVHTFFGCGNGGFQQFSGSTPGNFGQSVMDFRLTQTGYDSTSPFQSFVPDSPAHGLAPPLPDGCGCSSTGTGCVPCSYTFQTLNYNDSIF